MVHLRGFEPDFTLDWVHRIARAGLRLRSAFAPRVSWSDMVADERHISIAALLSGHGSGHHLTYLFPSFRHWRSHGPNVSVGHRGCPVTEQVPERVSAEPGRCCCRHECAPQIVKPHVLVERAASAT